MPELQVGIDSAPAVPGARDYEQAIDRMVGAAETMARSSERLTDALTRTSKRKRETADRAQLLQRRTELVARVMRETGVSATAARKAVSAFGKDMDRAEREAAQLARQVDRAEKEIKELSAAQRRARASASGLSGIASSLTRNMAALAAGVIGVHEALRLIADSSRAARELEAIQRSLEAARGDAQLAADDYEFLNGVVDRLGLSLPAAGKGFSQFSASAKETKLEGQGVRDVFTAVSGALVVLGKDSETQNRAFKALSDAISKGNLQAEELKGQLGEALPGAFQLMARGLEVSTEELNKMLERGEVLAERALPALAREINRTFGDQVNDASQGTQAQFNRLETAAFRLKAAFGEGLNPALVETAKQLSKTASENEKLAKSLGEATGKALQGLIRVLSFAVDNWEALGVAVAAIKWPAIVAGVNSLTAALMANPIIAGGAALAATIGLINQALDAWREDSTRAIDEISTASRDLMKAWADIDREVGRRVDDATTTRRRRRRMPIPWVRRARRRTDVRLRPWPRPRRGR